MAMTFMSPAQPHSSNSYDHAYLLYDLKWTESLENNKHPDKNIFSDHDFSKMNVSRL